MTAVNPTPPNATPEREQRPYEPSMEEILASIRRIIADDQSLPGRQDVLPPAEATVAVIRAPDPEPTTVHVLRPAPEAVSTPPERESTTSAANGAYEAASTPAPPSFVAHGAIAPQYATPEGPVPANPGSPTPAATHAAFEHDHIDPRTADDRDADRAPHRGTFTDHHHAYEPEPAYRTEVTTVYDEPLGRHEPTPFEPKPVETASLFSTATDQSIASAFNTLAASRLADNSDDLLSMSREMIRPLLKTWLDENLPSMVERLVRAEIERVARGGR